MNNYENKTKGQLIRELLKIRNWICEQDTLETERKNSDEIAKMMLDNVAMGISMISPKLEVIWLNKTFREWFPNIDIRKKPLCFKSFYSPPKNKICDYCPIIKALKTGEIHSSESNVCADGRIFNIIAIPIKEKKGNIIYVVEAVEDITEHKRMVEELKESEEKYRNLFNNEIDAVCIFDLETRKILDVNDSYLKLYGYTMEEVLRLTTDDISAEPEETKKTIEKAEHSGGAIVPLRNHKKKDGTVFQVEISAAPFTWKKRKIMFAIARDITERNQIEEALRDSEERYRNVYNTAPLAFVLWDRDCRITDWNKHAEKIFGWSREEVIGRNFFEFLIPKGAKPHVEVIVDNLLRGKLTNHSINKNLTKSGKIILCEWNNSIRYDKRGQVLGAISLALDITERKKIEEELLKTQKLESIGILAGGIAHDFNNILTAVIGNISLAKLLTSPKDVVYETLLESEKASLRAKDLTQQLLTFAKGGTPIKKVTAIKELIIDSASFALRGSNVKCEFFIPDDLLQAEVDEGQINQVINNLVINADQAMPEGGTIYVKAENINVNDHDVLPLKGGSYIKISIEDRGIGIPKEHLSKIFDPYFSTKNKGSGLGLASAYSIIKNHDGYINSESQLGIGTTFYIHLPASLKEIVKEKEDKEEEKPIKRKGRVLIMDDEESVRKLAGKVLNFIGYEVEFSRDGYEAIELYKKTKKTGRNFDVVILDLTVPGGMGGKEAIRKLLEIDPDVKAIVSSGYSNDPIMADFREYGFKEVAAKPYNVKVLSEILQKVISAE